MHFLLKQWCFPQYWQVNIACLGFIIGMRSQQRSKFYTNQGSFVPLASGWIDLLQVATILWNNLFGKTTKFITFASYFVVFDNVCRNTDVLSWKIFKFSHFYTFKKSILKNLICCSIATSKMTTVILKYFGLNSKP